MDFVRSHFGTNENSDFFPHFLAGSVLIWTKSEEKSVQLVRGSFIDFLQNPYLAEKTQPNKHLRYSLINMRQLQILIKSAKT